MKKEQSGKRVEDFRACVRGHYGKIVDEPLARWGSCCSGEAENSVNVPMSLHSRLELNCLDPE
jgi:hypothetical protein